jgi:hypothetical protein
MNKHIDKLIEETLDSVNGIQRAEAKPFLLTRIQARMNSSTTSVWDKAGWFISRPAVAFAGLCLIILLNLIVIMNTPGSDAADTVAQSAADEYAVNTVATIYDIENTQP